MSHYTPPVDEIRFTLNTIADMAGLQAMDAFGDATPDLVDAILEEAGKVAANVIAPTNIAGDQEGSTLTGDEVKTATGFKEAYKALAESGWIGLGNNPEYGGQGMPYTLTVAVQEMVMSANMAFSLCPTLSQGSVEALEAHASDDLKNTYLPKLISGEWTGSMCLTEPSAGSDVGALKTKATPQGDGTYLVKGSKIFITFGEHDFTDNIVHLVLARTPDAAPGTRGISMFVVPKYMVNDDGSLGDRNDVKCVSLEHKLGIHGSPTCVMSFGDDDKCIGYLIGDEGKGMRNMFTMMNHARLNIGLQGVGIGEAATQKAIAYAKDRTQGNAIGVETEGPHAIHHHADVRRMLMVMKAQTAAARSICYLTASAVDFAHNHGDAETRAHYQGLADLLTPVAKAYSTDVGVEVASLGVQVHGGMGFIEETGAAQYYRDARIAPIYEGTNGIQAMDLVGRKLGLNGGASWKALFDEIEAFADAMASEGSLAGVRTHLIVGITALRQASNAVVDSLASDLRGAAAGSVAYLALFSRVIGGYLLAKQAVAAEGQSAGFQKARVTNAIVYAEQELSKAPGFFSMAMAGDAGLYDMNEDELSL